MGGDFSDVFVADESHVMVLIGDVAGKGVPAAGMTETVRSSVRALAATDPSPAFILAKTNELLLRFDPDEPHVTAFLAVLDPHTGHLSYASAGHPAPVHLDAFACRSLDVAFGPPLGSFERPFTGAHAMLTLDSYLVLYTDGVTEARRGGSCSASSGCSRSSPASADVPRRKWPMACATRCWTLPAGCATTSRWSSCAWPDGESGLRAARPSLQPSSTN